MGESEGYRKQTPLFKGVHRVSHTVRTMADAGCSYCGELVLSQGHHCQQAPFFSPSVSLLAPRAYPPTRRLVSVPGTRTEQQVTWRPDPIHQEPDPGPMVPTTSCPMTQTPTTVPMPALAPSGLTASCPHTKIPAPVGQYQPWEPLSSTDIQGPAHQWASTSPKAPGPSPPCQDSTTPTRRLAATTRSSPTKLNTRPIYQGTHSCQPQHNKDTWPTEGTLEYKAHGKRRECASVSHRTSTT